MAEEYIWKDIEQIKQEVWEEWVETLGEDLAEEWYAEFSDLNDALRWIEAGWVDAGEASAFKMFGWADYPEEALQWYLAGWGDGKIASPAFEISEAYRWRFGLGEIAPVKAYNMFKDGWRVKADYRRKNPWYIKKVK